MERVSSIVFSVLCAFLIQGCCTIFSGSYEEVSVESKPTGQVVEIDGRKYTTPVKVNLKRNGPHFVLFPNGERIVIKSHFAGNPMWLTNALWVPAGAPFGFVTYVGVHAATHRDGSDKTSEVPWIAGLAMTFLPVAVANLVDLGTGASFDLEPDRLDFVDGRVYDVESGKVITGEKEAGK